MRMKLMCTLGVLCLSSLLCADYVIVGGDADSYTRFTDDFRQVWQTTGEGGTQITASPVNGDIYVGYTGDVIKRFNRSTGVYVSPNSGAPYQAKHGLAWGYDFNGDGVRDIWTVKNDTTLGYIQVTSGSNITQNLASFGVAHTDSQTLDGTGGRGCCFGPDLNGDGVDDFYAVIGWNNEYCRIHVWDPVALTTATTDAEILAARIANYDASDLREPMAMILGPDVNADGFMDLWVASQYGNAIKAYNYADGTQLGTVDGAGLGGVLGSFRQPRPLDVENGPNGTVLVTTRFATSLDPDYVAGSETKKGNLLQYDPITDSLTLLYGSFDIGRFDAVVYFADGVSTPVPSNGARVPTTQDTISWVNPDPNLAGSDIYCDVYFAESYPDYKTSLDPNTNGVDPNDCYTLNANFLDYATLVVDDQPNVTSLDLTTTASSYPLTYGQSYFWRVDTRDPSDPTTSTVIGEVYKFTADNTSPEVNAGDDVITWLTDGTVDVTMAPTVSDDGKPNPPAAYTVLWEESPESADMVINSPTVEDTTVTITAPGTYTLKLTADDGQLANFDFVIINVYADACAAAQAQSGYVYFDGDLDGDCDVDLADFQMMAVDWLDSNALVAP